jgi:phosphorylcholine metabolism protein LicD
LNGSEDKKLFISLDDDIDILMLRNEYDKVCKIMKKLTLISFFYVWNDKDYGLLFGRKQRFY